MNLKKILIIFFLVFYLLTYAAFSYAEEKLNFFDLHAQSAIVVDSGSGRILFGKNINEKRAMASTTKIMTCLLALESGKLEETVTISKNATKQPEVKLFVREGEKFKLADLLYPLMMISSNDVAVAVAEHLGGSVEGFATQMNQKADEIGMENTNFVTPNGLDPDDYSHYSTAYDMSLLAIYAMKNTEFIRIINTRNAIIQTLGEKTRSFTFSNTDRLLDSYPGANGIKTGFTNKAGQCFVGAAKQEEMQLVSVVLGSGWGGQNSYKWADTQKLLNFGFKNFDSEKVIEQNQVFKENVKIRKSKNETISILSQDEIYMALKKGDLDKMKVVLYYPEELIAPIYKDEKIGMAKVYVGDEYVLDLDLISSRSVDRNTIASNLIKIVKALYFNVLEDKKRLF